MNQNETVLNLGFGIPIKDAADMAINLAKQKKSDIKFIYNKVEITVSPDTTQKYIINSFFSQAVSQKNMGMKTQVIR